MLPQAIATGNIHIGTIAGKVERRDAGAHADRLAHANACRRRVPTFSPYSPLSRCGMPHGELDDLDAALHRAHRRRAASCRAPRVTSAASSLLVLLDQLAEPHQDARAPQRRRVAPRRERRRAPPAPRRRRRPPSQNGTVAASPRRSPGWSPGRYARSLPSPACRLSSRPPSWWPSPARSCLCHCRLSHLRCGARWGPGLKPGVTAEAEASALNLRSSASLGSTPPSSEPPALPALVAVGHRARAGVETCLAYLASTPRV